MLRLVLAYVALTVVVCPAVLWSGAVDLPDEFLEFGVADLAFWARELGAGHWPAWNPYKLGGMSVFADPAGLAPYYPPGWPLLLLPLDILVVTAWLLHLGIGAAGVHRWTRKLGGSAMAGAGAGIAWSASTPAVAALVDGQLDAVALLAWLPWALLAVDEGLTGTDRRTRAHALLGGALALGAIGLGSHTRFAAFGFLAVALYGGVAWAFAPSADRPGLRRWAPHLLGLLALGGLLAAPVVVPVALEVLLTRSDAPAGTATLVGQALSPVGLAGLVYPRALVIDERWYHLGAGVLLCLFGLRGDRRRLALLTTGALLLALGMGTRGPLGWAMGPVLWAFYPVETGAAAMGIPFLAAAMGLSLDRLEASSGLRASLGVAALGATALWLADGAAAELYLPRVEGVHRLGADSLLHGGLAVGGLALLLAVGKRLGTKRLLGAALALLLADGLAYAWRVEAAIPTTAIRPSRWVAPGPFVAGLPQQSPPGRILQLPELPTRGFERGLPADLFSHPGHGWGHDVRADPAVVLPAETAELLRRPLRRNGGPGSGWAQVGGRAKVPPMPWTAILEGLADADPRRLPDDAEDPERLARLLDLLHVRWVLSSVDADELPGLEPVPGAMPEGVTRLQPPHPRPAALLAPSARVVGGAREALDLLLDGPHDPSREVVLLRDARAPTLDGAGPGEVGRVLDWSPGRWTVGLSGETEGVLTIAASYHPGWRATADGAPLQVLRADLVRVGVVVPEGAREVELRFVAPGARAGAALGALGLLLLGLLLWIARQRSAVASSTPARQAESRSGLSRSQSAKGSSDPA